jgi:hypothetical protein
MADDWAAQSCSKMEVDTTVEEAEDPVLQTPQEDSYTVVEGLRRYWPPPGGENILHW